MSNRAMVWAVDGLKGSGLAKGPADVLFVLAYRADDVRFVAWPGIDDLVATTRYNKRSVLRFLSVLRDAGLIAWSRQRVPSATIPNLMVYGATFYTLNVGAHYPLAPDDQKVVAVHEVAASMTFEAVSDDALEQSPSSVSPSEISGARVSPSSDQVGAAYAPSDMSPSRLSGDTEDELGDTEDGLGDTEDIPVPIWEEKKINPGQGARARGAGPGRAGGAAQAPGGLEPVGSVLGSGCAEPTREDRELLDSCLPAGWAWRLDPVGVGKVLPLVRELLAASWTPATLRAQLEATAPPPSVRNWSGLIRARLTAIPVDGGPRRVQAPPVDDWRSGETDQQRADRVAARQARLASEPWWPDWADAVGRGVVKKYEQAEFAARWYRAHPELAKLPKQSWGEPSRDQDRHEMEREAVPV